MLILLSTTLLCSMHFVLMHVMPALPVAILLQSIQTSGSQLLFVAHYTKISK